MAKGLMRTSMYAGGTSPAKMTQARFYHEDCLVYDLEDSVSAGEKDAARFLVFNAIKYQRPADMPEYRRAHFGHSISDDLSGEEGPFFSPKETRVLEPGMVMCLEAPFYSSKRQTYSVEDTFLVTEDGIECFTTPVPSLYLR